MRLLPLTRFDFSFFLSPPHRRSSISLLLLFLLCLATLVSDIGASNEATIHAIAKKIRHMRGKYTVKEEVIKRVEISHQCKLTRTAVKVTFPSMKNEVLVSFIGYKEPNLMFVNRCKGLCSSEAIGRVACVPTKRSWKKVNMQLKTQVLGREKKEKFRELVLEEHEACSCQCLTVTAAHCMRPELFNNETCSCTCDTSVYRRDKLQCEAYPGRIWDDRTCSCRHGDDIPVNVGGPSGSLAEGGIDVGNDYNVGRDSDSDSSSGPMRYDPPVPHHGCTECLNCLSVVGGVDIRKKPGDFVTRNSWLVVTFCLCLTAFFASTTVFYWRRSRRMAKELGSDSSGSERPGSPGSKDNNCDQKDPSMVPGDHVLLALAAANKGALAKANSMTELEASHLVNDVAHQHHSKADGLNGVRMTNSLGRHDTNGKRHDNHHGSLEKTRTSGKHSSSPPKRHHKHKEKKKREKSYEKYEDIDRVMLNDTDLIQQCFFEDDLDPNFVNHQKIGAESMN